MNQPIMNEQATNEQTIILDVPNHVTKLAGYPLGEALYDKYVKNAVDLSRNITLVFPSHVDRIASSFVQGFFKEIKLQIGISGIEQRFEFQSSSITDEKGFILHNLT